MEPEVRLINTIKDVVPFYVVGFNGAIAYTQESQKCKYCRKNNDYLMLVENKDSSILHCTKPLCLMKADEWKKEHSISLKFTGLKLFPVD